MSCSVGDVLLIKFPYTDMKNSKKRPVLVIKDKNKYGDFVCFQITSNLLQTDLLKIEEKDFLGKSLPLDSFVKYDKCFTLNDSLAVKNIAKVNNEFLERLKILFCEEIF